MTVTKPPGTRAQPQKPQNIPDSDFLERDAADSEYDLAEEPCEEIFLEEEIDASHFGLVELILKHRPRLHRLIRDTSRQPALLPRLLAISLVGFIFYGVAMSLVLSSAGLWPELSSIRSWIDGDAASLLRFQPAEGWFGLATAWLNGNAFKLTAAYALGLIAATGVCLPSLYFYGLLAGVKMSMLDVVIHALKAKTTAAVALIGILPIYAAIGMGMVVFEAPGPLLETALLLGLALPFIAGFWGTHSLYVGFATLCDTMPSERRERRECFLRRLVFSWSACYSAVMPVMIFTLWQSLGT